MKRVLLISTAHPATDSRIVYKVLPSLEQHYEVICALPGIQKRSLRDDKRIRLPRFTRLLPRLLFAHPIAMLKCLRIRPAVVHIFVPELIPLAFVFRWSGSRVIYEVQEDLFRKFAIKRYNNAWLFQLLFRLFDKLARRHFHCIFTDDAYLAEYSDLHKPFAIVHNYASLATTCIPENNGSSSPENEFFYLGVVSLERCLDTMIMALARLKEQGIPCHLHLFGPVRVTGRELERLAGYPQVKDQLTFHGYTDQKLAFPYATRALAGIALLKPVADYPDSYPTKLFEYMALGLPVITSDFPLYCSVVAHSGAGFCIDSCDAEALYTKLRWLIDNPAARIEMGKKGREAVEAHYNWQSEEKLLLAFYEKVLNE